MIEATVVFKARHRKVKRHTRKQLYRLAYARREQDKATARTFSKDQARSARREARLTAPFEGCDPERTLRLIGEEA